MKCIYESKQSENTTKPSVPTRTVSTARALLLPLRRISSGLSSGLQCLVSGQGELPGDCVGQNWQRVLGSPKTDGTYSLACTGKH